MAQIGFIGLGNMGLPMAQNLIKAGHAVCGYDVSAAALDRFSAAGGIAVRSLDVASMGVDMVITMLPAREQVREVYLGQGGVLASAAAGTLLIDCSTVDVETARARGGGRRKRAADARCSSVRRRRRRPDRNLDLHGRRQRSGVPARQACAR